MINFFRKARKRLTTENKFAKYLLYAIGEIALIVIGILFALYLDNINTNEKLKAVEIKILKEISSNLNSSIIAFERTIQVEQNYLDYNLMILDHLDHKRPYHKDLDIAFGTYFWTISTNPITIGYDHLKSKGIDLIGNDSLRKSISFVFENEFSTIKKENEVWANNLQQNISYPYHVGLFMKYYPEGIEPGNNEFAKPLDYKALLEDAKFKSINAEIISNRRWNINSSQKIIKEIKALIDQIDKEIKKRNK